MRISSRVVLPILFRSSKLPTEEKVNVVRDNFEMSQEQLDELMEACKPVTLIALNAGTPASPQENANNAWKKLGDEMGFDHMTVRPTGEGDRFFSAVKL